jgi:uncharacterized protein YfaS (alpha-2-macroglobulin family)
MPGRKRPALPAAALLAALLAALPSASPRSLAPSVSASHSTSPGAVAPPPPPPPARAAPRARSAKDSWQRLERLVGESKLEQAARLAAELRDQARARGDEAGWTRGLVRETQVRIALHGHETAVRLLLSQPWPRSTLHRTTLDLFHAAALVAYYRDNSWQIQQRERVVAGDAVDLALWTSDQIFEAAAGAYRDAWQRRAELGMAPVARLADYVEPNNYPPGVRGTLRDTLSYLYADLLADSTFWSPRQSNELFMLDVADLVAGDPARAAAVKLDDPAVHPLAKLGAVLADLEAWHAGAGRRAAALEARLERMRRLHAALPQPADQARLRADLETRLAAFRSEPWWAAGMAQLAEMVRDVGAPDSLRQARAILLQGEEAYPDSPGGKRCRALRLGIEAPDFELAAMSADAPGRRSLQVIHKNLERLYFRAYSYNLRRQVEQSSGAQPAPSPRELLSRAAPSPAPLAWTVELPATPDHRTHRTYVTPPLAAAGAYAVLASARQDFAAPGNRLVATFLTLGDLVLLARPEGEGSLAVRALSGATGEPRAGVEVRSYTEGAAPPRRPVAAALTDAAGWVRFSEPVSEWPGGRLLIATQGPEVAFTSAWLRGRTRHSEAGDAALIYTDRSVYRPGQKVLWKLLAFDQLARGRRAPRPSIPVSVTLRDPFSQEVARVAATTNEFGTAAGELTLPPGRPLGAWSLESRPRGSATIQVEEYKRPTFEVQLLDPAQPLRLNREARLRGAARHYFGLPVTGGRVAWRVLRQPVYPQWWSWSGGGQPRGEGGGPVAAGAATLGADGTFEIAFTPRADERESGDHQLSYRYQVVAEVTDEGGETREAERAFRLGWVAVEASVLADEGFFVAGRPARVRIGRHDLDGAPRTGEGSWRLLELRQPAAAVLPADEAAAAPPAGAFETTGDRQRPRWADTDPAAEALRRFGDGRQLRSGTVRHDAHGMAELELAALPPGAYRLRYETRDDFGALCTAVAELVVAGAETTPLALPAVLLAEYSTVKVGDIARFLVRSGLPDQPLLLEIQRGERRETRSLRSGRDAELVEVAVGPEDRGGIAARLVAVRDHQLMQSEVAIAVPWDVYRLEIDFTTFRDRIQPGARETWRVRVRPADATAPEVAAAELLAYMYDRSLDYFAPHQPPSLLDALPRGAEVEAWGCTLGERIARRWNDAMPRPPEPPALHGDRPRFADWVAAVRSRAEMRQALRQALRQARQARRKVPPGAAEVEEAITVTAEAPLLDKKAVRTGATVVSGGETAPLAQRPPPPPPQLRSDFAETGFWQPHLLTGDDGTATLEFTVPDSVTAWNVWVHAVDQNLRGGSLHRETRSIKELMVRPYLPRFLREGDQAELKVVVDNASGSELAGELRLEILDPASGKSLAADFGLAAGAASVPFRVGPGAGVDRSFPLTAPRGRAGAGPVAFKVTASAGGLSDGELRALPVLPSRLHLAQSRFVALRGGAGGRELAFEDMRRDDDPTRTHEQLVVTLDAQLFFSVLHALPYLVDYPYECTEQTLNRFLSTGIVASLFDRYPAVARVAQDLAKRETRLETWDAADPNRKMALEETPWLAAAQGGDPGGGPGGGAAGAGPGLIRVLDPRVARAERDAALLRLEKAQLPDGAFPWWPGGPPSPYMTLYLMYGFAKASEFGVPVPEPVVKRGWSYLASHFRSQLAPELAGGRRGCCVELLTFLAYVASSYRDPSWMGEALSAAERRQILDASFRHWREQSRYPRAMLALALARAGRRADAALVWDSVMDAAKTTPEEGTFWAPEEHAWLWYQDTVESHALALRVMTELAPDDPRAEGLVQWLFLQKKLGHWKCTRTTAEVLYSLAVYLERHGQLAARQAAVVRVGGRTASYVFEPDRYTGGGNRLVVSGAQLDPRRDAVIEVEKQTPGTIFASATWDFSTERLPEQGSGDLFAVSRRYFKRVGTGTETVLLPLDGGESLAVGDEVEVQLALRSRVPAEYVHLRDPRAAGLEPAGAALSGYRWDLGLVRYEETHDSGADFFFESLPAGEYTLRYRLRANLAGTFRVGPATMQSMYAPEFSAYSAGEVLMVAPGKSPTP